jgi:hypothetical protein
VTANYTKHEESKSEFEQIIENSKTAETVLNQLLAEIDDDDLQEQLEYVVQSLRKANMHLQADTNIYSDWLKQN